MENLANVRGIMDNWSIIIQALMYAFTAVSVLAVMEWINKMTDKPEDK